MVIFGEKEHARYDSLVQGYIFHDQFRTRWILTGVCACRTRLALNKKQRKDFVGKKIKERKIKRSTSDSLIQWFDKELVVILIYFLPTFSLALGGVVK